MHPSRLNLHHSHRRPSSRFALATLALLGSACSSATDEGSGNGNGAPLLVFGEDEIAGELVGAGAGGPDFAACVQTLSQGEQRGTDMFVMLDHTGSMGDDCPLDLGRPVDDDESKWCFATHAFGRYFTSSAAVGSRVALQFMTGEDFVCQGGPDNGAARARVTLTELPVSENHPLIRTLDEDSPVGGLGTRIEAALRGMADYTAANQTPGRPMVGVLVTDGDANGCEEDTGDLADIIEEHLQRTGIRTFVVGMTGASLNNLERLARAGGAPEHGPEFCGGQNDCHFWSVGDGAPDAFVNALSQIEAAASVPCAYGIPTPADGEQLNPNLVNVQFSAEGAAPTLVERVEQCDQRGGWFYDDPVNPSVLRLCAATCDVVTERGTDALVDIAYGCQSVIR